MKLRNVLLNSLVGLVALLSVQTFAVAAGTADPYNLQATAKRTPYASEIETPQPLTVTLGKIINIALSFIGLVLFVLVAYSGFKWMTAQGNEDQVHEARQTIIDATVGIIVIISAYAITNFIFTYVITPVTTTG